MSLTKSGNFTLRYTGRGNATVHYALLDLRAILKESLKGRRAFHTFTVDENKIVKSVLKGLPEVIVYVIVATPLPNAQKKSRGARNLHRLRRKLFGQL